MTVRYLVPRSLSVLLVAAVAVPALMGSAAGGKQEAPPPGPMSTVMTAAGPSSSAMASVVPGPASSTPTDQLHAPTSTTTGPASATPVTATPPAAPATQSVPGPTKAPVPKPTKAPTTKPTSQPAPKPTNSPASPSAATADCRLFPSTNVWNKPIDHLPVRSDSAALISAIGLSTGLHPDFSNGGGYGIPYNVVDPATPRHTVSFDYDDESDPGPYPIPANPRIEGGSDRHLLSWDTTSCHLYELYDAQWNGSRWTGGSGAIWNLRSNALRPGGWTSADAAGLPILPGLVRYEEVAAGRIAHAVRFTAPYTARAYIYPARHQAGCASNPRCQPPMGLRVRLKASVDISGYSAANRVILTALKTYGMLLADNGSAWYITGAPDSRWNDDDLHRLGGIKGADFEAVDTTGFVNG